MTKLRSQRQRLDSVKRWVIATLTFRHNTPHCAAERSRRSPTPHTQSSKSVLHLLGKSCIALPTALCLGGSAVFIPAIALTQSPPTRKAEADQLYDQAMTMTEQKFRILEPRVIFNPALKALQIYQAIGDEAGQANVLSFLAMAYLGHHDYDSAVKAQQQAIAIAQAQKDWLKEDQGDRVLALIYKDAGNNEAMAQALEQALVAARKLHDTRIEITALVAAGEAAYATQNYTRAIDRQQQALTLIQKQSSPNDAELAEALEGLVSAYREQGDNAKALTYQKQVLQLGKGYPTGLLSLGLTYLKVGRFAEAEQAVRQGIAVMQQHAHPDQPDITVNDRLIAEVSALTGATDQLMADRFLQQVLISENKVEEALVVADRSHAGVLAQFLAKGFSRQTQGTRNPQAALQSLTLAPLTVEQIQQIARTRRATLVEYTLVYQDIHAYPGSLRAGDFSTTSQLRESELLIWVVQPDGKIAVRRVNLRGLQPSLSQMVALARQSIGVNDRGIGLQENVALNRPSRSKQPKNTPLQQLHQLLIQPIADLLPRSPDAPVIFVPQDSLSMVPFAALSDPSGTYLIQQHSILMAPSLQVLNLTHQLHSHQSANGNAVSALVVGNPAMPSLQIGLTDLPTPLASLPGAEREAIAIAGLLQTKPLIGAAATRQVVTQKMQEARIIHLATHGLLYDFAGYGVPGGIALAPTEGDLGFLTVADILDLKLKADLVVLSACNTARGEISGDGILGLSRALIDAGVPSIVVSLWSIPDTPTAELMVQFYQNLKQSPDKAQALRKAMLTVMQQYPDPAAWAGFMLIGES